MILKQKKILIELICIIIFIILMMVYCGVGQRLSFTPYIPVILPDGYLVSKSESRFERTSVIPISFDKSAWVYFNKPNQWMRQGPKGYVKSPQECMSLKEHYQCSQQQTPHGQRYTLFVAKNFAHQGVVLRKEGTDIEIFYRLGQKDLSIDTWDKIIDSLKTFTPTERIVSDKPSGP